ncbi:hypothetical protein HaLaN_06075 [Haematococcus lacustris]|uniref:Uncharacterized protein n=1 Tax=Haematococcus lacustris TaxID=44745 RepID=A0A699YKV3_HAELA|nr:hypothetical protein HaLaN_06075 [Haematococcus lacustris]
MSWLGNLAVSELPDLAQALTVRPPQFLLLAAGEEAGHALRGRLQGLSSS